MKSDVRDRLMQQVAFLNEVEKLKLISRHNRTIDHMRFENSAEHSWHVALMALVFAEYPRDATIDLFRVITMLLLHDLVEIYAGDTWLYDKQATRVQAHHEALAAERLFRLLPPDQAATFHDLWHEFSSGATPEAAFAAAIDGLQPLMNHLLSGLPAQENRILSQRDVLKRKQYIAASAPILWDLAQEVITASTDRGLYHQELDDG